MIRVTDLIIYPVKSLQGVHLQKANVLEKGFEYDRRWMIVDSRNRFITQRTHPQLSQISVTMQNEEIHLSHNNTGITLEVSNNSSTEICQVWQDEIQGIKATSSINHWISEILGESGFLVHFPEQNSRPVNPKRAKNNENVSLADGYPYLIISQESLDDLNSRIEAPVPMNRFRPNIVVEGGAAYGEDEWRGMKIGDVPFYGTHPCKRCVFTTIDQETGEKGVEPLKTLATYRRDGSEIIFGLNTLAKSIGEIKVGDSLVLL